jgi:uncharacterized protein YbbK (DUF523 family)
VIFVRHCLLNETVRYLGGACYPGPVRELVDKWTPEGVGICQMSCPEQRVWGAVLKRVIAPAYGASSTPPWPFRSVLAGSPSCGVRTTLDVCGWLNVVGRYLLVEKPLITG